MSKCFIRKIDELGRVVLPKEFRELLTLNMGDDIEIKVTGSSIILTKYSGDAWHDKNAQNLFIQRRASFSKRPGNESKADEHSKFDWSYSRRISLPFRENDENDTRNIFCNFWKMSLTSLHGRFNNFYKVFASLFAKSDYYFLTLS